MGIVTSRRKAGLSLTLLFFVLSFQLSAQTVNPVVKTNKGFVRGLTEGSILVFKGIPYAAPPLSSLRFMPPVEHNSWKDTLSATNFGAIAMQVANDKIVGSEDCLSLNVYTPAADNHKRAVVIWVHGGSMTAGSGKGMDGHAFADRDDIVTVTINYRLGVFGFMYLGDVDRSYSASANNGVLDCIMALTWIKQNIAAFGGDPNKVTIMGESAGAKLLSAVTVSPKSKGLFQQFIGESGSVQCVRDTVTAKKIRLRVLGKLHLEKDDAAKLLTLPADSLMTAQAAVCQGVEATSFFGPVNDGKVINNDPYKYAAAKKLPRFKALLGTNKTEATLFAATDIRITYPDTLFLRKCFGYMYPLVYRTYLAKKKTMNQNDAAISVFTQYMYQMHTYRWARALTNNGIPVWMYRFDYAKGRFGAGHAAELPFVWYDPASNTGDAEKKQLAVIMHGAWVAFIKTGNPNGKGLPLWSNYHNSDRKVMLFDTVSKITTLKEVFDDKEFPSSVFVLK
ncbi:MAG TPA: carboxylesterase family protein [Mucilaginibacter sp.]|jgi:para-nitrobenzyl esterase